VLAPLARSVTCTRSAHPRALDPTRLAQCVSPYCREVHVMAEPIDAYTYLLNASLPSEVVVVTGSLFLVGEVRAALQRAARRQTRKPAEALMAAKES
jgi:dihydrofolate synthase/folylpolyglutamate synthase